MGAQDPSNPGDHGRMGGHGALEWTGTSVKCIIIIIIIMLVTDTSLWGHPLHHSSIRLMNGVSAPHDLLSGSRPNRTTGGEEVALRPNRQSMVVLAGIWRSHQVRVPKVWAVWSSFAAWRALLAIDSAQCNRRARRSSGPGRRRPRRTLRTLHARLLNRR